MAYASWSVVFGEQPSAAKWNILGTNDASFNDGTGIANIEIGSGHTAVKNDYKFSVYRNSALSNSTGFSLVTLDTVTFDTGSNYSVSTGKFTAPISGFYFFTAACQVTTGAFNYASALYKNGSINIQGNFVPVGAGQVQPSVTGVISLAATDYVQVYAYTNNPGGSAIVTGSISTYFHGFLVSTT